MIYKVSWSNRFEVKPNRWVYNPTAESRESAHKIIKLIYKHWKKPSYYYHLRDGGHVEALNIHLENLYFATIDISDFLGNISRSRITRSLKPIVGYEVARKIAKISTVKASAGYSHSHHLPYGFNQSPILASICLFDSTLGRLLDKLNKSENIFVSVYMDDIVISAKDKDLLINKFNEILVAAKKSKFILSKEKSHPVASQTKAFNVVITHRNMQVDYDRFVKFQLAYSQSISEEQRHGIGSYVGSINKKQAKLLI
ncbi:reverse transcriptase domain-containing protein [Acinetobacter vivianii]|uniref:Reverse transcriptase domain-containing protein n=1 Tax=Acinetobacter vivianii TaxID=1776742 RepID=A0AAJ6NJU0_9GAMM|nr:reverse transcriptase domain-containing protein [Acinetobacter vivianii]WDZ51742.1 reverse transcriptase domain-containing protein [Acinetobacter vivianii]